MIDPLLFAPLAEVQAEVRYWPDRLRLAWAALTGRKFVLNCYLDDVSINGQRVRLLPAGPDGRQDG